MDVLLHRHGGYGGHQGLRVPDGLPQLVYDISREVLRRQPGDMYGFIAEYLESLVSTRAASGAMRDMMTDFFAELGGGETAASGNGPGGEIDFQEAAQDPLPPLPPRQPPRSAPPPERAEPCRPGDVPLAIPLLSASLGVSLGALLGSPRGRTPDATSSAADRPLPLVTVTGMDGTTRPWRCREAEAEEETLDVAAAEPKLRSALTKRPETHPKHPLQQLLEPPVVRHFEKEGALPKAAAAPSPVDVEEDEEEELAGILATLDGTCEVMTDTNVLLDGLDDLNDLDGRGSDSDETLVGSPDYSVIFPMDGLEDVHDDVCFHDGGAALKPDFAVRLGNSEEFRPRNLFGGRFQAPPPSSDDEQYEQVVG